MLENKELKVRAWQEFEDGLRFCIFNLLDAKDLIVLANELDEMKAIDRCTGLKDKNKKEIYEGDIVQYWDKSKEVVEWNEHGFWKGWGVVETGVIIGNIYENPELINGE